jgi:CHAT domain-containing protein/ankyrin repeat protein
MRYLLFFLYFFCPCSTHLILAQSNEEDLLLAVKRNQLPEIKELIKKGADVNFQDSNKASILMWAVLKGNLETVKYLVSQKADFTQKEGIIWLDAKKRAYYGNLTGIAAAENKLEVLQYLLEVCKIPTDDQEYNPEDKKANGWTALQWAASKGNSEIVEYLAKKGANLNIFDGNTPLTYAISNRKSATALKLIALGADYQRKTADSFTALHLATAYDLPEVVALLIDKKADIQALSSKGITAYELAVNAELIEVVLVFLQKTDLGASALSNGMYAIHSAAKNGFYEVVEILIKQKFNLNQGDKNGNTALHYAAYNNQTRICKLLIDNGADKNVLNKAGKTALDFANERKMTETIEYLNNPASYKEPIPWHLLNQEAVRYYNQNKFEKAQSTLEKALALVKTENGENSDNYASALENLADLHYARKNYIACEKAYTQSLAIRQKNKSPQVLKAVSGLAKSLYAQGKYNLALPHYKQILDSDKKTKGEKSKEYIATLDLIGNIRYLEGNYNEAEKIYRACLRLHESSSGKSSADYAINLSNLANVLQDIGRYSEAKAVYKEALNVYNQLTNEQGYQWQQHMTISGNYADLLYKVGEYHVAEHIYKNYILYAIPQGQEFSNKATILHNLGTMYLDMHRFEEAEKQINEALQLKAKNLGTNHSGYANTLNTLADLYATKSQYPEAEKLYKQILEINQENYDDNHPAIMGVQNNLAVLYSNTKRLAEAEKIYTNILKIKQRAKSQSHPEYAAFLNNLGMFYLQKKDFVQAEKYLKEALDIRKKMLNPQHPDYGLSLRNLAFLYLEWGKLAQSEPFFKEANENFLKQIKSFFMAMSEKAQADFVAIFQNFFESYTRFAIQYSQTKPAVLEDLLNLRLTTKALLLNLRNKIQKEIRQKNDTILTNYYQRWRDQKEYLAQLYNYSQNDLDKLNIKLQDLENQVNELERSLYILSKDALKAQDYTWVSIQKKLKSDEMAIETVRFIGLENTINYAFLLIFPSGQPQLILLENAKDLEEKSLKYYQNSIKFKKEDKLSYALYWGKIAQLLKSRPEIKKLYFSPDRVYNQISINALRNPETGKFVIDEIELYILTNIKDILKTPDNQSDSSKNAVFIGYPIYNVEKAKHQSAIRAVNREINQAGIEETTASPTSMAYTREFSQLTLTTLPGTKVEIETVEALAKKNGLNTQKYLAENALEEVIKTVKHPRILHIATHGYFLQDLSEIEANDRLLGIQRKRLEANPLLRTGLMLTGAENSLKADSLNPKMENGILTAYEAMSLDLDNTELVILSACETGLGEVKNSEGVYGLQRAFIVAGARCVLMSMWTVDDEATKELMTLFYENWFKTKNKHQAFRIAQMELQKKFPNPYYWGAFVLIGGE